MAQKIRTVTHDDEQNKKPNRQDTQPAPSLDRPTVSTPPQTISPAPNLQNQSTVLHNAHLPPAHRQRLAARIGQTQGNQHLQRALQRDPNDDSPRPGSNFQLPPLSDLSLPEEEGPSLGIGGLTLDTSPFLDVPVDSVLAPNRLFQIPPDLIESLLNEWWLQYLLLHPGPPPVQDAWEQVWSAWRSLTNEWLAQGEGAPFNRQLAQDTMRDRAAEAIMAQLAGEQADSGPDAGEIAGKVWQAFERALNRTNFYPRLRANAEAAAAEHWPALVTLLGGAIGTSLGLGLSDNEWGPMQRLTGLLPQLGHDFELGSGWTLSLGFDESGAIPSEEGSVIGVNPRVGLTWENEHVRLNLGGFTNLRIEGESGDVHANPGGSVTLDILTFE